MSTPVRIGSIATYEIGRFTSNNGSALLVSGGAAAPSVVFQPDLSGGLLNMSSITLYNATDDHLFEFVFLLCSATLLPILFFFVAAAFWCRWSHKEREIAEYASATVQPDPEVVPWDNGYKQVHRRPTNMAPPAQTLSRRGSFNAPVVQPAVIGSRRGSFNAPVVQPAVIGSRRGSFNAPVVQPAVIGSRRGSFNGMPIANNAYNANMTRQGSQRRASFVTDY